MGRGGWEVKVKTCEPWYGTISANRGMVPEKDVIGTRKTWFAAHIGGQGTGLEGFEGI
jgi:hypothetical protein